MEMSKVRVKWELVYRSKELRETQNQNHGGCHSPLLNRNEKGRKL